MRAHDVTKLVNLSDVKATEQVAQSLSNAETATWIFFCSAAIVLRSREHVKGMDDILRNAISMVVDKASVANYMSKARACAKHFHAHIDANGFTLEQLVESALPEFKLFWAGRVNNITMSGPVDDVARKAKSKETRETAKAQETASAEQAATLDRIDPRLSQAGLTGILAALPNLSADELSKVQARVTALLQREAKKAEKKATKAMRNVEPLSMAA